MENYFTSLDLFDDLATKQIYCCGTVRPNRKGMPKDVGPKRMTLKRGDLQVRTRSELTILWRDKRDVIKHRLSIPPRDRYTEFMAQVNRLELHSTKFGQSRLVTVTQQKIPSENASGEKKKVVGDVL
jgi:hypothetical protein